MKHENKGAKMLLKFVPIRVFHKTAQVSLLDVGVNGSYGADIVIHHTNAWLTIKNLIKKRISNNRNCSHDIELEDETDLSHLRKPLSYG